MLTVMLVRPGATEFDEQGRIKGCLDLPLSNLGREQAAHAASQLGEMAIKAVFHSPCEAARDSAHVLCERLGLKAKEMPKLRNVDLGLWHGRLIEEVRQRQPRVYRQWQDEPASCCPPEGEPLSVACERVRDSLSRLVRQYRRGGSIALVTPEPLASLVKAELSRAALGDLWKAACSCGTWEAIELDPATALDRTAALSLGSGAAGKAG